MNYVKHVRSCIKGGVDVELGYRTLIVGPNGSGKSAITASLEYALTGKVSDVVGRATVADVNQLLTLGPGDALFAEATFDSGEIIRCETKGKKSTPASYPTSFPLREVRDALAGGVETVRKFFLRLTSGAVTRQDVEAQIPGPYRALFGQVIAPTRIDMPAVDLLLFALERAKTRARELNTEAKASASVAAETTGGVQPVSESDLVTARILLDTVYKNVTGLEAQFARTRQITEATRDEAEACVRRDALGHQLATIPAPAEADRVREELAALLEYARDKGLTSCPCCRGQAVDWTERLTSVERKRSERAAELARWREVKAQFDVADAEHHTCVARLVALGERLADLDALEAEITAARTAAADAEQRVIQLERASAIWEQACKARDVAAEREIQATRWTGLADACATAVGALMDTAVGAFTTRVQKYLPPTDHFALQLRDDEREVCRFGFLREVATAAGPERRLDTALSGAEWARLCVALAATVVDAEGGSTGPKIIIPDDRSWDPVTLSTVLEALSSAPAQVIVATTTAPARVPEGWTVVQTGGVWRGVPLETSATLPPTPPLDAADDLSDVKVPPPAPPDELAGDYIAVGTCQHGVTGANCVACRRERLAREEAQRQMRASRDAEAAERRAKKEGKSPPAVQAAPPLALSTPEAPKRGPGRPKGSKNKPRAPVAPPEAPPTPVVSQDPGTGDPPMLE